MSHYIKYGTGGGGGGSGDVVGPASSTDNALTRFSGTTGKLIQNSVGILDDSGNLSGINLDTAVTIGGAYIYRAGGTDVPVADGGTGVSSLTDHGVLVGSGAAALTALSVGTDGQVLVGSTGADPVFATISSTDGTIDVVGGAGTLDLDLSANVQSTAIHGWNGCIIESPAVTVTSDGATITCSVEQDGGGDLTVVFSDGFYAWDTTPADTVTLTAGSDTSPQLNYVYFLQSTKTLTASTSGWPATEHAPIATVVCQSAASLQTDGAYKVHAWTDHVTQSNEQGHITDLNFWIRNQNATWLSGVAQTLTITPNGGAPDNVIFTTAAGKVLQLHLQDFPAFSGTPDLYVVNDSTTPYTKVTDLNALLTDSTGASMSGNYFSLVIWGVVSEDTGDCKLMVNLPSGSYGTQALLLADAQKYATYTIPADFKGTGFLISQLDLRHQTASSGTWTSIDEKDLRGLQPSLSPGGATAFETEFADNVFRIYDAGDESREIAFDAGSITTSNTRTITMANADVDLANVPSALPVVVSEGGTGLSSATAYAVLCGGTTGTGAFQSIVSVGTAGQVLTSNGAGALPTFQAGGAGSGDVVGPASSTDNAIARFDSTTGKLLQNSVGILDDTGNLSGIVDATLTGNLKIPTTSATVGQIQMNSTRFIHAYGSVNLFVGGSSGNFTLTGNGNTGFGANTLGALTTGSGNTCLGRDSGTSITTGNENVGVGYNALRLLQTGTNNCAFGVGTLDAVTGSFNTAFGKQSFYQITSGQYNVGMGRNAGGSHTTSDSSNICIGYEVTGAAGVSNRLTIGAGTGTGNGQINAAYISGIYNTAVGATAGVVLSDSSDQLGGLAGAAETFFVGGTKPSFTASPTASGTITGNALVSDTNISTSNGDLILANTDASSTPPIVETRKTRTGGIITTGDRLAEFNMYGHDGTGLRLSARIVATSTGTVTTNRVPSKLDFYTHPDSATASTLRMTIAETGEVTIAAPDSGTGLTISGGGCSIAGGLVLPTGTNSITSIDTYGGTVGGTNSAVLIDNTGLMGTTTSSLRYKENVEDMGDRSSAIFKLRPVNFNFKKDRCKYMQWGLIAEEVHEVMPEIVNYDKEGRPDNVRYHDLPAIMLNEMKKMAARIEQLEKQVALLQEA